MPLIIPNTNCHRLIEVVEPSSLDGDPKAATRCRVETLRTRQSKHNQFIMRSQGRKRYTRLETRTSKDAAHRFAKTLHSTILGGSSIEETYKSTKQELPRPALDKQPAECVSWRPGLELQRSTEYPHGIAIVWYLAPSSRLVYAQGWSDFAEQQSKSTRRRPPSSGSSNRVDRRVLPGFDGVSRGIGHETYGSWDLQCSSSTR
ncbi:hypothetical protein QBC36DRAFT_353661 [Triangularia setosa]|uniref:Uncharacterized protein n=1 Tax=Triangularia setosa TaxID=2587417 RepID=A0AAN7A6F8_9PEZI|nr:hypothetical protein QBC36DRAFT_353661 [Podospora setosa]